MVELWLEGSAEGTISLSDESECADVAGNLIRGIVWSAPRLVSAPAPTSIVIYPNPATDRIWISGIPAHGSAFGSNESQKPEASMGSISHPSDSGTWVKFYDLQGRILAEGSPDGAHSMALPNVSTGIIQVEVHSCLGVSRHKLLVKGR